MVSAVLTAFKTYTWGQRWANPARHLSEFSNGQEPPDLPFVLDEPWDPQAGVQRRGQVPLVLHVPLDSLLAQQWLWVGFFLDQGFRWPGTSWPDLPANFIYRSQQNGSVAPLRVHHGCSRSCLGRGNRGAWSGSQWPAKSRRGFATSHHPVRVQEAVRRWCSYFSAGSLWLCVLKDTGSKHRGHWHPAGLNLQFTWTQFQKAFHLST